MGSLFSSYRIWRTQAPSTFPPVPKDDISDYSSHNYCCIESLCMSQMVKRPRTLDVESIYSVRKSMMPRWSTT